MKKLFSIVAVLGVLAMIAGTVAPANATYNQQDSCNQEFEYTKTSDFSDSRVEIDFINTGSEGNPDSIKVEAKNGYSLIYVKLDVENDNQSPYYDYSGNFPGTFNPNPGEDVDGAKVKVKKVCVTPTVTPTATPTPSVVITPTPTPVVDPCNENNEELSKVAYDENENEVDPCVTPTATPEPTQPPQNPGGPGDGKSDGRSDGRSSCPECTKAPTGQVLGASTDFAGTGTAVDMLMNAVGVIGGLSTAAGIMLAKKRNA